jgi:hypothetical protein
MLGAGGLMLSAALEPWGVLWFVVVIGCSIMFVASVTAAVILVRRWGRDHDDFWWPDE